MSTWEERRQIAIQMMKEAFSVRRGKKSSKAVKKLTGSGEWLPGRDEIIAVFQDKSWTEITTEGICQISRDIDILRWFSGDAIEYYLPAFLTALLDEIDEEIIDRIVFMMSWRWGVIKRYDTRKLEAGVEVLKLIKEKRYGNIEVDPYLQRASREYDRKKLERMNNVLDIWSKALEAKKT